MINFAVIKHKKSTTEVNNDINCPINHNLYQKRTGPNTDRVEPNLQLEFILKDFVLPPKSILIGECMKKKQNFGWTKRYLMLGSSQLLISRDKDFNRLVNVVPLEGGFCMI